MRTAALRYGRHLTLDGPLEVTKRRSIRYFGTFEYVEDGLMFMLRLRLRLWEVPIFVLLSLSPHSSGYWNFASFCSC